MLLSISKANYMIFYHKKKVPPPANIQFTIDETSLTGVKKEKIRILGIVIAEQISFTQHVEVHYEMQTSLQQINPLSKPNSKCSSTMT